MAGSLRRAQARRGDPQREAAWTQVYVLEEKDKGRKKRLRPIWVT